jgi:UDP-N-acetyl-D-mannosaminuronic acid dehydrogenase/UDP-N-acetyl-D-glucosamine dehydrogenase
LVTDEDIPAFLRLVRCELSQITEADLVIVLTDHDEIDWDLFEQHADRVLDTRNRLRSPSAARL